MKLIKEKSFTLLELLIVVIVIGILVTIALPQYFNVVERGRRAEALSVLGDIRKGEIGYQIEHSVYNTDLSALYNFNETPTSPRFVYTFNTALNAAVATPIAGGGGTTTYYLYINGTVVP